MDTGRRGVVGGLIAQVQPTFMLPAVGMSLFGGLLAPTFASGPALVYALAVGSALYVAHLVDEYVDAHLRGEEPPTVPEHVVRVAVVVASAVCLALLGVLWLAGYRVAAATGVPLWFLALFHAPFLDTNPLTVTVDYPVGMALATVGGAAVQQRWLPAAVVWVGLLLLLVLSAVKISIDRLDYAFDRRVGKRTVPVVLGDRRAAHVSAGLLGGAAVFGVGLVAVSVLATGALLAVPVLLAMAVVGLDTSAPRAVTRQMVLVYPVVLVLFVSQCLVRGCVVATTVEHVTSVASLAWPVGVR